MIVSLYKYSNKSHVANKIDGLSPVFTGDITPYGAFNARTVTFRLSEMYEANLCRYEYNHHAYYGSCTIDVDSNGLYVYSVNIDALTTAWYNNCMSTKNVVKYSKNGNSLRYDDRLFFKEDVFNYEIPISAGRKELTVIMAVKSHDVYSGNYLANPNFEIYAFTVGQFNDFMSGLNIWTTSSMTTEELQAKYVPSIYALFAVPTEEINFSAFYAAETNTVRLWKMLGESSSLINYRYVNGNDINYISRKLKYDTTLTLDWSQQIISAINYPLTGYRQKSIFTLHVANMGDITFRYSDVSKDANITNIGYAISYDFVGGRKNAYLIINGEVRKNYCLSAAIPLTFSMSYDSSIQRWDRVNSSVMGSIINIGATVIAPHPITISGLATQGIGLYQQVQDAIHEQNFGARSTVGSVCGSSEQMTAYGSFLTIQEVRPIDAAGYQELYGYPDGQSRNIATLSGYVETHNAKFVENGIPADIVREAERQSDAGFYII